MSAQDQINQIKTVVSDVAKKNPYYLVAGILFFIFIIYVFLILFPQIKAVKGANADIREIRQKAQRAEIDAANVDAYRKEIISLEEQFRAADLSILSMEGIPFVLEKISRLADKYQIKIDDVTPSREGEEPVLTNENGEYYPLIISLAGRGGYHAIGRFINDLEQLDIFLEVNKLGIFTNKSDPRNHLVSIDLKAIVVQ